MSRLDNLADNLVKPLNPTLIVILGVYTIVWGLWVLLFDVTGTVPAFAALYSAMPSETIGGTAFIVGAFICRGAAVPNYPNLIVGAGMASAYWLFVAVMLLIGQYQDPIGISSMVFGIYASLVWINLRVNREHYKKNH